MVPALALVGKGGQKLATAEVPEASRSKSHHCGPPIRAGDLRIPQTSCVDAQVEQGFHNIKGYGHLKAGSRQGS